MKTSRHAAQTLAAQTGASIMAKRTTVKRPRTSIVEMNDGYHINYNREDGYSALIDTPYFSANCIGYFETQHAARLAVAEHRIANPELYEMEAD